MEGLHCQECGHENRGSARFCASCGTPLLRICPSCDAAVSVEAKFCDTCGTCLQPSITRDGKATTPSKHGFEGPERRQMTVLFCDLVGSVELSRQLDPEELRQVLSSYQNVCANTISRYEGYVSRYMGDGVLALFGYPQAHDDDAQRAARAALELVEKVASLRPLTSSGELKLSVHIGIATGWVVAGDVIGESSSEQEAVIGETPNLAARIQGLAKPDSILISATTYRLIRNSISCQSVGSHALKGYPDPVLIYQILSDQPSGKTVGESPERDLAPLTGRDWDLERVRQIWSQAKVGSGGILLVQGEPGIGKSRLVREVKRLPEVEEYCVIECRCSPYFSNSALQPVVEMFRVLIDVSVDDTEETVVQRLQTKLGSGVHLPESVHELATILLVSQKRPVDELARPRERQRLQPFEAIVAFLLGLAEQKPALFIVEDLHWVDPSTSQLLGLLVDQVPLARMLVLATARPEFRPEWLTRSHTNQLTLGRLTMSQSEAIVAAITQDRPLPDVVRRLLVAKTDGVPLFIEELTQAVLELEAHAGSQELRTAFSDVEKMLIPETLRDSLMARLDRLGDCKPIAQLAAVIGRNFSYRLLSRVAKFERQKIENGLAQLVKAELLYQKGMPPEAIYQFKHSLIQEIAYHSLLTPTRREFHRRIADAIGETEPHLAHIHPELIARHYTLAGDEQKAVRYWAQASVLALQRSADIEAAAHAREGLRILGGLEEGRTRDELGLSLHLTLGASLSATEGDAIAEVGREYNAALELCKRLDAKSDLFPILRGIHAFYLLRGPLDRATDHARQLLDVATESEDLVALTEARRCLGWTLFCSGSMCEGRQLLQQAIALYDQGLAIEQRRHDVHDAGGVGLINLAWVNWFLGYAEQALLCSRSAISLARQVDHPFTLGYALCMGAAVHQCRNEPDEVYSLTEEVLSLSSEQGFRYWMAWGTSLQGWALAQGRDQQRGGRLIQEGLTNYRLTEATLFEPYILCMLAESVRDRGEQKSSLPLILQAVEIERQRGNCFFAAETHRLLGETLWNLGDEIKAMEEFSRSLEIARGQQAKPLELRTLDSLLAIGGDDESMLESRARREELLVTMEERRSEEDYPLPKQVSNHLPMV